MSPGGKLKKAAMAKLAGPFGPGPGIREADEQPVKSPDEVWPNSSRCASAEPEE